MRRYIDAHVHLTGPEVRGKRNVRFNTELKEYGFLQMDDGGFYTMPPFMHDSQFTVETLIHVMDAYNIEKAVILQSLMNEQSEYIAQSVAKYPDRLLGAMVVEPVPEWKDIMDYWYSRGMRAIKYEMRAYTNPQCYPDIRYTTPVMLEMFRKAASLGLTITIDPGPVDFPVYQPDALKEAILAVPDARFVLCHMAYPLPIDTPEQKDRWHEMLTAASLPNCWLDVSAMPDMFDAEGWPYPTALSLLAEAKKVAGAEKLIWGTDITGSLNRATYPQMRDMFLRADCLDEADLDRLFYLNAKEAYQL